MGVPPFMNGSETQGVPPQTEKLWRWFFAGTIVLGLGLRLIIYLRTGWTILDGLIGFRFAEQFAAGHGLVFNTGERVSGNTSLLYTILLGLAGCGGLDIPIFSRIVGVACDLLTVFLLKRLLVEGAGSKSPALQYGLPAALFVFPLTFPYGVSSMETPLYVSLIFLLAWRTLRPPNWGYYATCAAIVFCRPDSVVFLGVSLLYRWMATRRLPWVPALVIFGLGLSYLGFNHFYYGSMVPNTLLAKKVFFHDSIRENFHYIATRFLHYDALLALALALAAVLVFRFQRNGLVRLTGLMTAGFLAFLLTAPHLRSWYLVPFFYLLIFLLGVGVELWLESRPRPLPAALVFSAATLYVAACGACVPSLIHQFLGVREYEQSTRTEPGLWLRDHTPPDTKVFVTALEVGYYSKRYTLDTPGLVTPAVWKLLQKNPTLTFLELAEAVHADYALVPIEEKPLPSFQLVRYYTPSGLAHDFVVRYGLYRHLPAP